MFLSSGNCKNILLCWLRQHRLLQKQIRANLLFWHQGLLLFFVTKSKMDSTQHLTPLFFFFLKFLNFPWNFSCHFFMDYITLFKASLRYLHHYCFISALKLLANWDSEVMLLTVSRGNLDLVEGSGPSVDFSILLTFRHL